MGGEREGQYLCSGLRESVSRQLKYSGSMVKAAAMAVWFASSSCLLTVLFTMMSSPKSSSSVEGSSSSEAGLTPKVFAFLFPPFNSNAMVLQSSFGMTEIKIPTSCQGESKTH